MSKDKVETKGKKPEEKQDKGKKILGKIACILIAMILWVYVSYDKNPTSSKLFNNVPVSVAGIEVLEARNLTILTSDMYVSVKLSGDRTVLSKVKKGDIKAVVNVTDITTTGEHNPEVTISGIPDAINVEERKITSGKLEIDRLVKKNLKLNIDITGKVDAAISQERDEVFPTHVNIKGPESLLNNVSVWTEPVDISNIKQSETSFETGIVLKDNSGNVVKAENSITISENLAKVTLFCKGMKEVPVELPSVIGSLEGFEVVVEEAEPSTVAVEGSVEEVNILDLVKTEELDAYEVRESGVYRVKLLIPENIICHTTHVNVKVTVNPVEETQEESEEL